MVITRNAKEIAEEVAGAGALIEAERNGVVRAAISAIKEERKGAIHLTRAEAVAALAAISQMTAGNARDFHEWKLCTHGTHSQWLALLRAEVKIKSLLTSPRG